jgi:hypothetical protein
LFQTSNDDDFTRFVNDYLVVRDAKCYRHCRDQAKFVALKADRPGLVGGYFCPGNYASRVVYFSLQSDSNWFEKFLKEQAGELVRSKDIRWATRHGWELGGNAESEIPKISKDGIEQYYWTLYPASDEEKTKGAFRCENCGRLFVKGFSDDSKLCSDCKSSV